MQQLMAISLGLGLLLAEARVWAQPGTASPGRIVWWGQYNICDYNYRNHTNGLVESGDEFISNGVAITAGSGVGVALRADGTVSAFGLRWPGMTELPINLSNVVSVTAAGDCYWAIHRDGTVIRWGSLAHDEDTGNIVPALTNVASISFAGGGNVGAHYFAVLKDGTMVGFRLGGPERPLVPVNIQGKDLTDIAAAAPFEMTPLVLKKDGAVYALDGLTDFPPEQSPAANLVSVNGQPLTNITAIASDGSHALALKSDGTVVAWGDNSYNASTVPPGLDHVIAISAAQQQSLALKSDGTVVSWGNNYFGQETVPAGLSNVTAVAAGFNFNLAITTGSIPPSVFIRPHGRLEEMEQKASLVFKGQVLSTALITNSAFIISQMTVNATTFKVISVVKGSPPSKPVVFEHYSGDGRMFAWSGPSPAAAHQFEVGKSYLVFAASMDQPDFYYSPPTNASNLPGSYRQIADVPRGGADGVIRTLDARPLPNLSVKEAHWFELNLLLTDQRPTNMLCAIDALDRMSLKGEPYEAWHRSNDFKRNRVLTAFLPLTRSTNETVALRALGCFEAPSNAAVVLQPFAPSLMQIANGQGSSARRLAAIRALSGIDDDGVSNSLARLLQDPDQNVRANAIHLVPRFPAEMAEPALRNAAQDSSPKVRAAVAEAIGDGKMVNLLPTLEVLFADPIGRTNPVPPLTIEEEQAGDHIANDQRADVHDSAGNALLEFDIGQVSGILKSNLGNEGFHPAFLCKLAGGGTKPWLTNLVEVLQARRERLWKEAQTSSIPELERTNYFYATMTLSGTYFSCWNLIQDYLTGLPPAEFQKGRLDWCLDVLENSGNTGSQEPVKLYELYKTKGLTDRATAFRRENGKCRGFDVTQYFDQADRQLAASSQTK